ncbi:MAG: NYN domain-containing protein [Rhodobacteraceae bacterium]|nr:NYN domain-containing protein [Paracoccaceae bacterium]
MTSADRPKLAILIDADNTSPSWAESIIEEVAAMGEATVRRIYGDFSSGQMKRWSEKLARLAIVPHQQFANTVGKNSSDIALVIDAMDLLHSGRVDGFCLVSSDSDFTRLASRIREEGADVIGIGRRTTPEAFRMACKRFLFVENLTGDTSPPPGKPTEKPIKKLKPTDARDLVLRAMDAIEQEDEWYSLGQIGQQMTAANPDFDPRSYGKRKLSDLINELKLFELRRGAGNQFEARRID